MATERYCMCTRMLIKTHHYCTNGMFSLVLSQTRCAERCRADRQTGAPAATRSQLVHAGHVRAERRRPLRGTRLAREPTI